jgi:peptidoglycan-associated lipoprotein
MSKQGKGFALGMALIALGLVSTACPKKPKPKVAVETAATTTQAVVSTTSPAPDVAITPPRDFVQENPEPRVTTEDLPTDIEEANRVAQQRGYVRDAFFEYNESTLSADAQSALTSTASWLKNNPRYNLLIEGHCDERGTEQYNLALGDRRANIAREYLATLGVDNARIRTVSYGEERPFDPGHDESAYQKNRRAHLVLVGR